MANIGKAVRLMFVAGTTSEIATSKKYGNNKFYDMVEIGGELHSFYGRVPEPMPPLGDVSSYKKLSGVSEKVYPIHQWDSIYRQKVGKGYKDMSNMYKSNEIVSTDEDIYAPIKNKNIANIVNRLQILAKDIVNNNYKVSPYAITQDMVDEAQRLLNQAMIYLNAGDEYSFNNTIEYVFSVLPRRMDCVDKFLAGSISGYSMQEVLTHEQDLLDMMKGQIITPVRGQKVVTQKGDKKTILEINGIKLEEPEAIDIELVKRKLGSNASRLKNVWKVENEKQTKAFNSYLQSEGLRHRDCKLLFHGTRSENVWNILKTGLVLRPTNAVITGKMFGYGLYFAPSAQKSLGYTSLSGSYWAGGKSDSGFMILHSVAYGKPYVVDSFNSKYYDFNYAALRRACPGAHCLHADSSKGMLRNDEIVVYKEEQIMPLYLIEIG